MEPWEERRARFGYAPGRPCVTVDGTRLRAAQLSCRSMNFGSFHRTEGIPRAEYAAEVPVAFLLEMMEREHPDYVADSIEHPDPENAFEQAQRERGWPSPREMLADPVLLPMTLELYGHDLLLYWLGGGQPPETPGWVANTIMHRALVDGSVVIGGVALMAGR
ncbi:MAG TPA: hypothetical protein VF006_04935 [Longimicrobium sp.]